MTILGILGMLVTIVGPVLTAGLLAWLDKKREERIHATVDETDEYIKAHYGGNPAGLVSLARQLERLQREARRKRTGHSG